MNTLAGNGPLPGPRPRRLHPGPRVRLFELVALLDVVLIFLVAFLAWLQKDKLVLVLACVVLGCALGARALWGARSVRLLKQLAAEGKIAQARIMARRRCRITRAPRADGALPLGGLPLVPGLEVHYAFEDDQEETFTGFFLTRVEDAHHYAPGRPHEIYYLLDEPCRNVSSLVLRWYWRLGGPQGDSTDELPGYQAIDDFSEAAIPQELRASTAS